jgi:hypothetical protein
MKYIYLMLFFIVGQSIAVEYTPLERLRGTTGLPTVSVNEVTPDLIDFTTIRTSEKSTEYLSLFTQTCDNIGYSGLIENQVISVLNDTEDFIRQVTDPVVNISKFEAGIFLYAFAKCMGTSIKEEFTADCKTKIQAFSDNTDNTDDFGVRDEGYVPPSEVDTGQVCLFDQFLESVGNVNKGAVATVGGQGSVHGSTGITAQTTLNTDKFPLIMTSLIQKKIDDGWFDYMMVCVYREKTKVLKFLANIFNNNFKVKSSIITSINNRCNVSLQKPGDPTTWDEIYQMNSELLGNTPEAAKSSLDNLKSKTTTREIEEQFKDLGITQCIDGYGEDGCLTEKEKGKLKSLSKHISEAKKVENFDSKKAYKITGVFYDSSRNLLEKYEQASVIQEVLNKYTPTCGDDSCSAVDLSDTEMENYKVQFHQLKDSLNIKSGTELSKAINSIFYSVFKPRFIVKLNDYESLKLVPKPLENPFDESLLVWGPPKVERYIVMKTVTGEGLSISNKYKEIETERIKDFYKSLVSSQVVNNAAEDLRDKELGIYMKTSLVSEARFDQIKDSITSYLTTSEQEHYGDILGNSNVFTQVTNTQRASQEQQTMKDYAFKIIIKAMFSSPELPKLVATSPTSVDYSLISAPKDYTIPINFNREVLYKKIRRFFQALSIRYQKFDIADSINTLSRKMEDWNGMRDVPSLINSLTQRGNLIHEKQRIKNANLFNFRE